MSNHGCIIAEREIIAEMDKKIAELEGTKNKLQNQLDAIVKLKKREKTKVSLCCFPKNRVNRYVLQ